jgi:hypothetical protein
VLVVGLTGTELTGQTVVLTATVSVTTLVEPAGQYVTVSGQSVTVLVVVL